MLNQQILFVFSYAVVIDRQQFHPMKPLNFRLLRPHHSPRAAPFDLAFDFAQPRRSGQRLSPLSSPTGRGEGARSGGKVRALSMLTLNGVT